MGAIYNIGSNGTAPIEQGADYTLVVTASVGGLPMNLTGYTVKAQLRKKFDATEYTDFDAVIFAPIEGKVSISLSATVTAALAPTNYVYDCILTSADGKVIRLIEGRAYVTPEVTR